MGLWQHRLSQTASLFCVCTFFASLFFHLFSCYPVHKSWQIKPYAGGELYSLPRKDYRLTDMSRQLHNSTPKLHRHRNPQYRVCPSHSPQQQPTTKLTTKPSRTDITIMCVPIPLILAARIRTTQKAMLCCLFSSGIFVMVAAFLRAYYSVKNISSLSTALGWASREALVSVITVSAPGLKPLITRSRWFQSYGSSGRATGTGTATIGGSASNKKLDTTSSKSRGWRESVGAHPIELSSSLGWKKGRGDSAAESQEHIIGEESGGKGQGDNRGILVTTDLMFSEDVEHSRGQKNV